MTDDISLLYDAETADRALRAFVEKMVGFTGLDMWTLFCSMERDSNVEGVPDDSGLWTDWMFELWTASGFTYDVPAAEFVSFAAPPRRQDVTNSYYPVTVQVGVSVYPVKMMLGTDSLWPAEASSLSRPGGRTEGEHFDLIVRNLHLLLTRNPDLEDKRSMLGLLSSWDVPGASTHRGPTRVR
ncbi:MULTISPECIES: hypothetical protein [unclassified Rathayibacter]|uniref:hypothetical protein n=1 Tax=unclassified Rathayibacter TaxID=2609250 RepID=UPI000CE83036|nr:MULTISPECIES: hypothetical protein [unclassified Rathayibacter]PPG90861.1 hypothetical protein C5C39_09660 [Rathayibacter sp. AY1F3]PPH53753.1 hypothetical protein C5C49_04365 [Rathayibacter sp. AY1E2]